MIARFTAPIYIEFIIVCTAIFAASCSERKKHPQRYDRMLPMAFLYKVPACFDKGLPFVSKRARPTQERMRKRYSRPR